MHIKRKLARIFALNGLVWLPLLIALVGIGFCAAATYLALSAAWGAIIAALVTGLGLLILASLVGWWVAHQVSPAPETNDSAPATDQSLDSILGDGADDWIKDNTGPAMLAALAAGALIAASPTARKTIAKAAAPIAARGLAKFVRSLNHDLK